MEIAGVAANGKIALALLEQNPPDVVTLDIEMPEMDGLTTLKQIRNRYPKLPVIMFSTLTERGAVSTLDALSLGATDYVTKPTTVADPAQAIASIKEQLIPRIKSFCRRFEVAPLRTPAVPIAERSASRPSNCWPSAPQPEDRMHWLRFSGLFPRTSRSRWS